MTHEEKRKVGRRKKPRRMYDALSKIDAPENVKHVFDKLLWSKLVDEDRRINDRRSGDDRREER